jgi:hypothetical protein
MSDRPRIEVLLTNAAQADSLRRAMADAFGDRIELVKRGGQVKLLAIEDLPEKYDSTDPVVAIGDPTLPELIGLLGSRPWLNHMVSPRQFESTAFPAAVWQLAGQRLTSASFLGERFHGRRASLRDSEKRAARVDAIVAHARDHGATSRSAERVADLAEELLSNALYNAPAERDGQTVDRSMPVRLPKGEGCTVVYGVAGPLFLIRVKDPCGSLTRERLLQVLNRCVSQSEVSIDHSRGGAGLGIWRIFSQSSLIVIQVQPNQFTDFIAGINLKARRPNEEVHRELHLFIGNGVALEDVS